MRIWTPTSTSSRSGSIGDARGIVASCSTGCSSRPWSSTRHPIASWSRASPGRTAATTTCRGYLSEGDTKIVGYCGTLTPAKATTYGDRRRKNWPTPRLARAAWTLHRHPPRCDGPNSPGKAGLKGISWIKSLDPQFCRPIPGSRCEKRSRKWDKSPLCPTMSRIKIFDRAQ